MKTTQMSRRVCVAKKAKYQLMVQCEHEPESDMLFEQRMTTAHAASTTLAFTNNEENN